MILANSSKEEELSRFLHKLPSEVAKSFNEEQRQALMTALTHTPPQTKRVDVRRTFSFLGRRFYFVILLGKDQRTHKRLASQLHSQDTGLRRYLSMGMAGCLLAVVVVSTTYLTASTMGIQLFPQNNNADNVLFGSQADTNEPQSGLKDENQISE